ncbi:MAG TPA: hypothetical protein VI248_10565 [Kineosporiaceae bacterium]
MRDRNSQPQNNSAVTGQVQVLADEDLELLSGTSGGNGRTHCC